MVLKISEKKKYQRPNWQIMSVFENKDESWEILYLMEKKKKTIFLFFFLLSGCGTFSGVCGLFFLSKHRWHKII